MSRIRSFLFCLIGIVALAPTHAQTTPTLSTALSARSLVAGGPSLSFDLQKHFTLPSVTGTVAQFDTTQGKFNAELFAADTPKTVANFLNYATRGAYTNSIVHRSVHGFVIQSGGYTLAGNLIDPLVTDAPVQNEPKFSNTRGTLAMAKTDAGPNTATSQWFVNLANNSSDLDGQNGGFTVFGRVLGTGMSVVDAIAAIQVYDASAQLGAAFKELPLTANGLSAENFIKVKTIGVIPVQPELASDRAVLTYTVTSSNSSVATVELAASTVTVRPLAAGSTTITVRATDTNGSTAEGSFVTTVVSAPLFTFHPASQGIAQGTNTTLSVAATGGPTYRWQRNGGNLSATTPSVLASNMQPALVGLYTATATSGGVSTVSDPAILGVKSTTKVIGSATEIGSDILHPNGNTFDQVLLQDTSAGVNADVALNQITRMSYIDLDNDIVQIEFSGPGTLSVTLDEAAAPAPPLNYNQPTVSYMKGHASIVIAGADENTNVSIFSVGRLTAFDPTGAYNILLPVSASNDPAKNGSPLFQGHGSTAYDGIADIARISILSTNGKFGGIRAANAHFYDIKGFTGIYAPGVTFVGPVYVGDIIAYEDATPVLVVGGAQNNTWITGGDLKQANGQPILISGVSQLKFMPGIDSHGKAIAAQKNQGILHQSGVNVTSQIVVNPQ